MNVNTKNIIVNSSGYTPVYFIQNSATHQAVQARSYYTITQTNQDVKPVSDNLRKFYESSGNLENSVVLKTVENNTIPAYVQMGNNLKLANFLLPKSDEKTQVITKNKIALKSLVAAKPLKLDTTPKMQVDSKIVKLNNNALITKPANMKTIPRITSNENLNQLNDNEMKVVNQALKNLKNPLKVTPKPTYDPVSNTKFVYKIISPKDLTVVGKNRVVIKQKKNGIRNDINKTGIRNDINKAEQKTQQMPSEDAKTEHVMEMKTTRSGRVVKLPKQIVNELSPQKSRKKGGTLVSCIQCSTGFESLYRLQKHYDNHPTHIPTKTHSNLFHCLLAIVKGSSEEDRSNIFIQQIEQLIEKLKSLLPCLLKKIDGNEGKICSINEDIGRLFGMNPGKYSLNMDALDCVRNKGGYCKHNPAKSNAPQFNSDLSKPSQLWLSKHNEEIANIENETDDCARINSVERLPVAGKRVLKLKQQKSQELNAKRMRLTSENNETLIELGNKDLINFNNINEKCVTNVQINTTTTVSDTTQVIATKQLVGNEMNTKEDLSKKPKTIVQFHSTHFDIRSSPIKPSATVFHKIQINPQKFTKLQVQALRPLSMDKIDNKIPQNSDLSATNEILQNNGLNTSNEILQNNILNVENKDSQNVLNVTNVIPENNVSKLNFEMSENNVTQANSIATLDLDCILKDFKELQPKDVSQDLPFHSKEWSTSVIEGVSNNQTQEAHQSHLKPNNLIEPALLHVKDELMNKSVESTKLEQSVSQLTASQNQSVLNFLEDLGNECLTYPETDIKSGADDFSDLFSFHNA